jgi:hypothetical protein
MKVRIEGSGHIVEIETADTDTTGVTLLAQRTWEATRQPQRLEIGFGPQMVERTGDQPVAGGGAYELKPEPVTA